MDIVIVKEVTNFDLFNRVVKYVIEYVGNPFSANAIVKCLKSEGRSLISANQRFDWDVSGRK